MVEDEILSEGELLNGLRKRKPVFADIAVERPVTLQEVGHQFLIARRKRADVEIVNHVLNLFFEPKNPFEPQRIRKPKMETTVFGTLFALAVIAVLAFNLAALRP